MTRKSLQAQVIGGLIAGGVVSFLALALAGCPNSAGDCHLTLSCPLPSCAEAGDGEPCVDEDAGEDGGNDAPAD